jgi:hypothetical protein
MKNKLNDMKSFEKIMQVGNIDEKLELIKSISNSDNIISYKTQVEKLINDKSEVIQLYAFDILLNKMKVNIKDYEEQLISILSNRSEGLDLRNESISYLVSHYFNKNNKRLIKLFFKLFLNESEENTLRASFFIGALNILGLSSKEIMIRNLKMIINVSDINTDLFKEEIERIEKIERE